MITRTPSILFWFGLIIIASIALYRTSDRVQELNRQLHELNAAIDSEQQSIHVLKAEWAYLSSPARVETAAKKFLALRPTAPKQIVSVNDIADIVPMRSKTSLRPVAVAAAKPVITAEPKPVFAAAKPIATIKTTLAALAPHPLSMPHHKPAKIAATTPRHDVNDENYDKYDHMIIERTASAQPLPDSIGSLITELSEHP